MTDFATLVLNADSRSLKTGERDLASLTSTAEKTERAVNRANDNMASGFEKVGKASIYNVQQTRMAAMQLSQVAQQASATGNWLQALAIQLPDLALGFGPIGIAAGAAAGALLSYFATFDEGKDEAEVLREQANLIQQVADRWGDAVPALREYADQLQRARDNASLEEGVGIFSNAQLEPVISSLEDAQIAAAALVQDLQAAGEESGSILELQNALAAFTESAEDGHVSAAEMDRVTAALAATVQGSGIPAIAQFEANFNSLANAAYGASQSIAEAARQAAMAQSRMNDPRTWRSFGRDDQSAEGEIEGDGFMLPEDGPKPDGRGTPELSGFPWEKFGSGRSKKKRGSGGKTEAERYESVTQAAERRIASLKAEFDAVGMAEEAAARLKNQTDLLNDAQQKNISLTDPQREKLMSLADTMAHLEAETDRAKEAQKFFTKIQDDLKDGIIDSIVEGENLRDTFEDIAKSIAKAALEAALFNTGPFAGLGSGGGGGFLAGLGKLFSFDGGGYTGSGSRSGGADGKGGFLAMMHPNETVIDHSKNSGGSGGGQVAVDVTVGWSRSADGNLKPFVEETSQKTVQRAAPGIVNAANKQVMPTVARFNSEKAGGDYRLS